MNKLRPPTRCPLKTERKEAFLFIKVHFKALRRAILHNLELCDVLSGPKQLMLYIYVMCPSQHKGRIHNMSCIYLGKAKEGLLDIMDTVPYYCLEMNKHRFFPRILIHQSIKRYEKVISYLFGVIFSQLRWLKKHYWN